MVNQNNNKYTVDTSEKLMGLLTYLKDVLFGIVTILYGSFVLFLTENAVFTFFNLLLLSIPPHVLGCFFITIGIIHCLSRLSSNPVILAAANVMLAFVFLLIMLSQIYISLYAIAWLAFAAISLNQVINAYLYIRGS